MKRRLLVGLGAFVLLLVGYTITNVGMLHDTIEPQFHAMNHAIATRASTAR
jgi:hypothetical protein